MCVCIREKDLVLECGVCENRRKRHILLPPDSVAYLSSPGQEIWRESPGRGEEEGGGQLDPLLEERWSSATLKVLSSMPSRTIGKSPLRHPYDILMAPLRHPYDILMAPLRHPYDSLKMAVWTPT